jgi:uncharacterized protein YigE (DUF2233 family)
MSTPPPAFAQKPPAPCTSVEHEGARFTVCEFDTRTHDIRLAWAKPDGQPYAYLSGVPAVEPGSKKPLIAATNAGMFHADLKPVGLYVENGRQVSPISTKNGPGNFHLKPNGVFYMSKAGAGVMETGAYIKARLKPDFATQSGPMLVVNGQLHPKFVRAEASRKPRNGVGVRDANTVVVAITETDASFASFARLYRDVLKCPNALFLDGGSVPTLYAPSLGRGSNLLPMGPILSIYAR